MHFSLYSHNKNVELLFSLVAKHEGKKGMTYLLIYPKAFYLYSTISGLLFTCFFFFSFLKTSHSEKHVIFWGVCMDTPEERRQDGAVKMNDYIIITRYDFETVL